METTDSIKKGIAWCLAWGDQRQPQAMLEPMRQAIKNGTEFPREVQALIEQVEELQTLKSFPNTIEELQELTKKYPQLWHSPIGLVYGGATKIKQYVFEAAKLPDIRGASALLDRINLIDLPAFFSCEGDTNYPECQKARDYCIKIKQEWLDKSENFPELSKALIPELIIYSKGGNILAFCPVAFIDDLANAIEKRYTEETLTANSCAVGSRFKLLEIKFGLLPDQINKDTFWLEKYLQQQEHPLVRAYFEQFDTPPELAFQDRKSFNELAGKLASLFNQRRSGNSLPGSNRVLRCYPPMFETHPYLQRDESDRRSAIIQAKSSPDNPSQGLPGDPWFSEASARKRLVGQIAKRDDSLQQWYDLSDFTWNYGSKEAIESWVNKFAQHLYKTPQRYYGKIDPYQVQEARSVREISDASNPSGFVAYIYADGNNMGGYIQKQIKTPLDYKLFSEDIFNATEKSVYAALTEHLEPHKISPSLQVERNGTEEVWIHPFEILTIGGDDVMLIVPADKALAIAKTIGEEFEKHLRNINKKYKLEKTYDSLKVHRYQGKQISTTEQCKLSISSGVLITADDTPIYYAQKLTEQLLKSAKKYAKELKKNNYYGGTVDFLVMKSVTMISSNINEFRQNGLTKFGKSKLKLYAAPYTLYELGGLLTTAQALKDAGFPRSQLYQIRSLLEQGKQTAILNYRYFRVRLSDKNKQNLLKHEFEERWCKPKDPTNNGNLAPWMSLQEAQATHYETIWRELIDLYPFIQKIKQEILTS